jgi:lysophospholipase L1-like esterase
MFIEKREYFKDSTHLNHEGASLFTSAIIAEIKKALAL